FMPQYGLSEVRFFSIPVLAREPYPAQGAVDIPVDVTLGWRAGRESAEHEVSFSSDEQAVNDGTAPVTTVTEAANGPLSLDLGQTYYWQIVEVNNVETPAKWQGNVWGFTTEKYIVVDDFELYNDIPEGEPGSNLVYVSWVDGFDNPNVNGSTMGYVTGASMEADNVHSGKLSVPMEYNNTTAPVSEVTANLANLPVGSDWAKHSIRTLSLWFAGNAANVPGQLYVKLNGSKVVYDGELANLQKGWQVWNIELASFGVDLQNVTTISIGVEGANATGVLLLDDIRLYPYGRELVTPVEPGTADLIGYWKLDGDALDYSGRGNDGIAMGDATYELGKIGQAMKFDGGGDYLVIDPVADDITNNDITLSAWVQTADTGSIYWFSCNTVSGGNVALLGILGGRFAKYDVNIADVYSRTLVNDLEWHHLAYTRIGDIGSLYVDGVLEGTHTANFNYSADDLWSIGQEWDAGPTASNFLTGSVDDARIYDSGLSYAEIAALAGRTLPFDKPFED
ncbi:MAG: LamG domain-containing protein, partial [Phycisphaerales bacterium]